MLPAGRAPGAGHAQRAGRPREGLPGLGMRRGRTARRPGSRGWACAKSAPPEGGAHELSMRKASSQIHQSEEAGGGDRPAVPGRVASTCAKLPTAEPRAQLPCRPTCQKTWRVVPRVCHSYHFSFLRLRPCPSSLPGARLIS